MATFLKWMSWFENIILKFLSIPLKYGLYCSVWMYIWAYVNTFVDTLKTFVRFFNFILSFHTAFNINFCIPISFSCILELVTYAWELLKCLFSCCSGDSGKLITFRRRSNWFLWLIGKIVFFKENTLKEHLVILKIIFHFKQINRIIMSKINFREKQEYQSVIKLFE